jgi:hypothetical protein
MSEILSNIVVEQTSINFSPNNNNLNVTPEAIQLNIFTGAAPSAGQSSNGELLYNNTNLIDGVPNTSFASGNLTLGNVANIKITGGVNGYVLQTDGAGNLDWTAMTGNGGGNGTPGGSNTQIQYNDSGAFGGASGFTFNEVSGNVAIPGALAVTGTITGNQLISNIATGTAPLVVTSTTQVANLSVATAGAATTAGTVTTAAQPNITSVGTLTSLGVNGNITAANITANTGIFTGSGAGLTNIPGANVTGPVANATVAATVSGNFQPNITSVGTLSSLNVTNAVSANLFSGSGANLTNIPAANIVGNVPSANTAITVTANAQPNITSVGNLTTLRISNTMIHLGANAGLANQSTVNSIAIGTNAGNAFLKDNSIAIGNGAGQGQTNVSTATSAIAIGNGAGSQQNIESIAIGNSAGTVGKQYSISIGSDAGFGAGNFSINLGYAAGTITGANAITMGYGTAGGGINSIGIGRFSQSNADDSITIGANSIVQGPFNIKSIAIGAYSNVTGNGIAIGANSSITSNNTILLNATNANLTANIANALFVKPIRNASNANIVMYNQTSGEVTYNTLTNYTGYVSTISTTVNALVAANSVNSGTRAYVTDGNTTTFYSVIGSGGSNGVPVFSDGTDWRVG